jgi:hypothetical protein
MRFGLVRSTQWWFPGVGQWRRRILGEQADKPEFDYGAEGNARPNTPVCSCRA